KVGTNWLFLDAVNLQGASGLLFPATITTDAVTVRSGNGVTFLLGPSAGDFGSPFSAADFSAARSGPATVEIGPNPLWIPGLVSDPSARWIGTNADAGCCQGNTGLYAAKFTIPTGFSSAILTLDWAADDGIS